MAVLTTALTRLRGDFNERFPRRDKTSDGWIGDARHAESTSGHNPDESGGGEYEDADSKDEVRAIDVDVDFGEPGVTAQEVVDAVLSVPADLARLRYIIYDRRIWSRNTAWKPRAYTGANPHDKHIHFSGAPEADESAASWRSVLNVGSDMNWNDDVVPSGDPANPTWGVAWAFGEMLRRQAAARDFAKAAVDAVAALAAGDAQRAQEILAAVEQVDESVLSGLGALGAAEAAEALIAVLGEQKAAELVSELRVRLPIPPVPPAG